MLLEIESSIGTLTFTNDSCVNDVAFPDPDDTTSYYQCFSIDDGTGNSYWNLYHGQCPPGGYFDPTLLICMESPVLPSTITMTPAVFTCTTEGTFPSEDCSKYYRCITLDGVLRKYIMTCPENTFFNATSLLCTIGTCSSTTTLAPPTTIGPGGTTTLATTTPPPTTVPSTVPTTIPTTVPTTAPTTVPMTVSTTILTTTTLAPFQCKVPGTFPDPSSCRKYIRRCVCLGHVKTLV
ncbi:Transcription elongation regulator 1 [Folsomia candida]|uniref:Transcription elongation regulator 1 n=1 Tax=Folsomia candida TaxID=158441 RepID=A0A226DHQ2_FOLCA|nr:Transcription elongation regulator 1 [Folsomia candida]